MTGKSASMPVQAPALESEMASEIDGMKNIERVKIPLRLLPQQGHSVHKNQDLRPG